MADADLSDYHLTFMAITSWLIDKQQLGDLEQQRAYIRAFQSTLLIVINNRLQLKDPDHHLNVPYKVQEVYDAAQFILQGTTLIGYAASPQPIPSTTGPSDNGFKIESLTPFMAEFTKTSQGIEKLEPSSPIHPTVQR